MAATYPTPAAAVETETEVKKSRFIARATKVCSREEAFAVVARARHDFPDARHHCWAYLLGNPQSAVNAAMSDDGEPGGTAGRPILNVIQHKGVGDLIVVVTRYFGGIKLGAGGLVRAYSGAAEAAMSILPLENTRVMQRATLTMDFSREQPLRHWLGQHQGEVQSVDYGVRVVMRVSVPQEQVDEMTAYCAAARAVDIKIEQVQ
ncbi:MAG: YigZ family protein [Chromatiales bacterium]|nr:YigZ family protein [Chromatiales bacterium]